MQVKTPSSIYFPFKTEHAKRLIFGHTDDDYKIGTPFITALILYTFHIGLQNCSLFEYTFPIYRIFDFSNFKDQKISFIILRMLTNIIRWILEGSIGYCIYAAGIAIKKRFGMGNAKDFFLIPSALKSKKSRLNVRSKLSAYKSISSQQYFFLESPEKEVYSFL